MKCRVSGASDLEAPKGTPVPAMGNGQALAAGHQGGYGKLVVNRHSDGYKTFYGRLSGIARGVRKGEGVTRGQLIGHVGATGISTGPHLHFEMRVNDRPVNPQGEYPRRPAVPEAPLASYRSIRDRLAGQLGSAPPTRFAAASC